MPKEKGVRIVDAQPILQGDSRLQFVNFEVVASAAGTAKSSNNMSNRKERKCDVCIQIIAATGCFLESHMQVVKLQSHRRTPAKS